MMKTELSLFENKDPVFTNTHSELCTSSILGVIRESLTSVELERVRIVRRGVSVCVERQKDE